MYLLLQVCMIFLFYFCRCFALLSAISNAWLYHSIKWLHAAFDAVFIAALDIAARSSDDELTKLNND